MTNEILRHEVRLVDVALSDKPLIELTGLRVWVAGADAAFRQSVHEHFKAAGCEVTRFDDPQNELVATLARPDIVIDGGLMRGEDDSWFERLGGSIALMREMQALQDARTCYGLPRYVGVVWADEGLPPTAVQGIWSGLAKTLPREVPSARAQVLTLGGDVNPGRAVLSCLVGSDTIELTVTSEGDNLVVRATLALPMPVGGDEIHLDGTHTVVMTGGARGIGFALALALAERSGCRVLVSGREDVLAHGDKTWMNCSYEEFVAARTEAFRARGNDSLTEVRRRFATRSRMREIVQNLSRASERGARIKYVRCDVTDAASVNSLLADAGPGLAIVVHNAGIDSPSRLATKKIVEMRSVIAVKLDGMRNIVNALGDHKLAMLCLVGSLTGRYGGMIGQLDYSAANETLAFASRELATRLVYPVKCLAWPTWDGLGLITNMAAASRYMRPITVEEGVGAWIAELEHSSNGEIAFMANFAAVSAQHLIGVPVPSNWQGARRMLSRRFFLGEVVDYDPTWCIVSRHRISPKRMPYFASGLVDGKPAIPITAVLEYLVNSRDGFLDDYVELSHLTKVTVHLEALSFDNEGALLEREIRLLGEDTTGVRLAATLTRLSAGGERVSLATAVLNIQTRPGNEKVPTKRVPTPLCTYLTAPFDLRYRWSEQPSIGRRYPDVLTTTAAIAPILTLPTAELEALITAQQTASEHGADTLWIDRLGITVAPEYFCEAARTPKRDHAQEMVEGLHWGSASAEMVRYV